MIVALDVDFALFFSARSRAYFGECLQNIRIFDRCSVALSGGNVTSILYECIRRHGSSIANFVGILTEGLRIAPAEADASGYAFGKGGKFCCVHIFRCFLLRGGGSNRESC